MQKATLELLLKQIQPCVFKNSALRHNVSFMLKTLEAVSEEIVPESFWHNKAQCSMLNFYGILYSLCSSVLLHPEITACVKSVSESIKSEYPDINTCDDVKFVALVVAAEHRCADDDVHHLGASNHHHEGF